MRPVSAQIVLGGLIALGRASTVPLAKRNSTIEWFPCSDLDAKYTSDSLNTTCGFFEVPLDWADDSVGTAKLAVVKLAASKERWGTVFMNPGGPGGSGLDFIFTYGANVSDETSGHYDVVSWDVRGGLGHSTPGTPACFDSAEDSKQFFAGTLEEDGLDIRGKLTDDGQVDEFYSHVDEMDAKFRGLAERCLQAESGKILPYVGTAATARDMVALADYLEPGVQEINFWGISGGTVVGATFVNMFPDRVGHVVLDACVDPTLWYNRSPPDIYGANLLSAEDTYTGLVDNCAAAGRGGCHLLENDNETGADIKARLQSYMDLAHDLHKAGVDLSKILTSVEFRYQLLTALFMPPTWSTFDKIAVAYNQSLAALSANLTVPDALAQQLVPLKHQPQVTYEAHAIWCGDGVDAGNMTMRDSFDAIVEASRDVSPTFGPKWWNLAVISCFAWSARAVERYTGPWDKQLKNRVIVLGNAADPGTAFKNAESLASQLGSANAVLVKQNGYGHSSLVQKSTCTGNIIRQYFENGSLPEGNNTECEIDADVVLFPEYTVAGS
ncbi:TAP-like protein-domain-containing protein [Schizophyllum commune]